MARKAPSRGPVPRFLDAGDRALIVELGNSIDEVVNREVVALDRALAHGGHEGIVETMPTYRSLFIAFDPDAISKDELRALVLSHWPAGSEARVAHTRWCVPVHYCGDDLERVASLHGLKPEDVIALHASAEYRVFMIGFAPGFTYLGGLPERLHTSRRKDPRLKTPPGSVSIGGQQAAVSPPLEVPSGWHLLGRTPVRSYDPARTGRPFLFSPGDLLRFRSITREEFEELSGLASKGDEVADREVVDD